MQRIKIISEACGRLKRRGFNAVRLEYRPVGGRRAIDIIAAKGGEILVIRGSENTITVREEEAEELRSSSRLINATALIVSRKVHNRIIEDDVIYERHSIPTVTPTGLEKLVEGEMYVYSDRGGYFVEIDGEALRRAREERGLSLGDLASMLGVSRKAVYMYERGEIRASIGVALKLIEYLGEDVVKPLSIDDVKEKGQEPPHACSTPDVKAEQKLIARVKSIGLHPLHFRTTPTDVIVRDPAEGKLLFFTIEHGPRDPLESKLKAAIELSKTTGYKTIVLASRSRLRSLRPEYEGSCDQISIDDIEDLSEEDLT